MRALAFLVLALTVAATPPGSYPVRGDSSHHCDAGKVRTLVGRRRSPGLERVALQRSGAGIARWIPPGTMVTMDYRPDRLDIHLDRRNRIVRINCG